MEPITTSTSVVMTILSLGITSISSSIYEASLVSFSNDAQAFTSLNIV